MQSLYTIIYCVCRFLLLMILLLPLFLSPSTFCFCLFFKSAVFRLAFLIVQTNKKKFKKLNLKANFIGSKKETPTTNRNNKNKYRNPKNILYFCRCDKFASLKSHTILNNNNIWSGAVLLFPFTIWLLFTDLVKGSVWDTLWKMLQWVNLVHIEIWYLFLFAKTYTYIECRRVKPNLSSLLRLYRIRS